MNPKQKDDDLFDLNPKTHYNFEPLGYMKPIDAPSSKLRPTQFISNNKNEPAVDLSAPMAQYYRSIPIDYMNYVNTKINYLYK